MENRPVIVFDGFCKLCNGAARFILKHDRKGQFRLEPLQGSGDERVRERLSREEALPDSVLVLLPDRVLTRSAAALYILVRLRFPWPLLGGFYLIPRFLRDVIYDWIARNRTSWFGRSDACFIPDRP